MRVSHELSTTSWVTTCCCKKSQREGRAMQHLGVRKAMCKTLLSLGGLGMVDGSPVAVRK